MSEDHLKELDRILASMKRSDSRDRLNAAAAPSIPKSKSTQKLDMTQFDSLPDIFTQIYDEFEAPRTPPPLPPDDSMLFELAPPPPAPIVSSATSSSQPEPPPKSVKPLNFKLPPPSRPPPPLPVPRNRPLGGNAPPSDVLLPPNPPPRALMKKSATTPNFQQAISDSNMRSNVSIESLDGPDEIDYGEHQDEQEKKAEEVRRRQVARMSQMIRFDKATPEDVDLDTLLEDLDAILVQKNGKLNTKSRLKNQPLNLKDHRKSEEIPPVPARKSSNDRLNETQALSGGKVDVKRASTTLSEDHETAIRRLANVLETAFVSMDKGRKAEDKEKEYKLEKEEKMKFLAETFQEGKIFKISTRIYIENGKNFKTLLLNSLMTVAQVTDDLVCKCFLEASPEWTLFEIISDHGIERPLRDFEIVTDVIRTWDEETVNSLLIKKYKYRDSLSYESSRDSYPRMCGWLYLEVRKGKWQKKFFELKSNGLYYSKDSKGTDEMLLCSIINYDVYTLMKPLSKAPTKFVFALKSQQQLDKFAEKKDYIRYVCVEHVEKMKDWVLSIRNAKSHKILSELQDHETIPLGELRNRNANRKISSAASFKKSGSTGHLDERLSESNDQLFRRESQRNAEKRRAEEARRPSVDSSLPRKTAPAPAVAQKDKEEKDKPSLIALIEKHQGLPEDNTTTVNTTQFGDNGKPLVPFTARELFNIPGVDLQKYVAPTKPKEAPKTAKPCSTCGCVDFARNPFRVASCANCFHVH